MGNGTSDHLKNSGKIQISSAFKFKVSDLRNP